MYMFILFIFIYACNWKTRQNEAKVIFLHLHLLYFSFLTSKVVNIWHTPQQCSSHYLCGCLQTVSVVVVVASSHQTAALAMVPEIQGCSSNLLIPHLPGCENRSGYIWCISSVLALWVSFLETQTTGPTYTHPNDFLST